MRKLVLIVVKLVVSVALLYFVFSRMNFASTVGRLDRIDLGWLAASTGIALLQAGLSAIRWQWVALACGAALAPARTGVAPKMRAGSPSLYLGGSSEILGRAAAD